MRAISAIRAREILDSRGIPTVECDVQLIDGSTGTAAVPSGASTGRHEALELRDRDNPRYRGLGVQQAVANVNEVLGPVVTRLDATDQNDIDRHLRDADGTPQKSNLGANAVLAVSLAVSRAAAASKGVPLYRHIAHLAGVDEPTLPRPMINLISGGAHARGGVSIQDVLLIPTAAKLILRSPRGGVGGISSRGRQDPGRRSPARSSPTREAGLLHFAIAPRRSNGSPTHSTDYQPPPALRSMSRRQSSFRGRQHTRWMGRYSMCSR